MQGEKIGYDELQAARVKQLREIDDMLAQLGRDVCRRPAPTPAENLACVYAIRTNLFDMIRVAEAEHDAF